MLNSLEHSLKPKLVDPVTYKVMSSSRIEQTHITGSFYMDKNNVIGRLYEQNYFYFVGGSVLGDRKLRLVLINNTSMQRSYAYLQAAALEAQITKYAGCYSTDQIDIKTANIGKPNIVLELSKEAVRASFK